MKATLISPPLGGLKNDPFGSIPSLPVGVPYIAGYLRANGVDVKLIDSLGENPKKEWLFGKNDKYQAHGITTEQTVAKIPEDTDFVGIGMHSGACHQVSMMILKAIKEKDPDMPVVMGGNLATSIYPDLIRDGADYVMISEGEVGALDLVRHFEGKKKIEEIDGIAWKENGEMKVNPKMKFIKNLDEIPFPAIDLLPLQNYWDLGYAHGPFEGKYSFLMTSRGCPFGCHFCATPSLWQRRWRARSPRNIVDEMEHFQRKFGINDYHIQDDIFTVNTPRVIEFCKELINRKLDVTWQVLSTKAETVSIEALHWMKKAGCDYLSVSPETGSPELIKKMNKPFDYEHCVSMVKEANKLGIKTQCCFILGYPEETDNDRAMTKKYIARLARNGLDEIGAYIMCPLPGAEKYKDFQGQCEDYEEAATFSPRWRKDYEMLNKFRQGLYKTLLVNKTIFHPIKLAEHAKNLMTGRYKTKIEAGLVRHFKTHQKGDTGYEEKQ